MESRLQQLVRLRRKLSGQLKDLESGKVKVLVLIDGGRTDEDATHECIEELQSCLQIIDAALVDAVAPGLSPS